MFAVTQKDRYWMGIALQQAEKALRNGETPVGAVIVQNGTLLAKGRNRKKQRSDPAAHAEIDAIRKAARKLQSETLEGAALYVTLEPCVMCAGAIQWARIERVVFGADEPKFGAVRTHYTLLSDEKTAKFIPAVGGCRAGEAKKLMQTFFKALRGATLNSAVNANCSTGPPVHTRRGA